MKETDRHCLHCCFTLINTIRLLSFSPNCCQWFVWWCGVVLHRINCCLGSAPRDSRLQPDLHLGVENKEETTEWSHPHHKGPGPTFSFPDLVVRNIITHFQVRMLYKYTIGHVVIYRVKGSRVKAIRAPPRQTVFISWTSMGNICACRTGTVQSTLVGSHVVNSQYWKLTVIVTRQELQ